MCLCSSVRDVRSSISFLLGFPGVKIPRCHPDALKVEPCSLNFNDFLGDSEIDESRTVAMSRF